MTSDWLFGFPSRNINNMYAWVEERLAEDPTIDEIDDVEAEAFFCTGLMLRGIDDKHLHKMCRAMRIPAPHGGETARRRAVIQIMRQWIRPRWRELLTRSIPCIILRPWLDPLDHPDFWTEERFEAAYRDQVHVVWLAYTRRFLGMAENLSEWLAQMDHCAQKNYNMYLKVGKILLRRLVYPAARPFSQEVAAANQTAALAAAVRDKDRHAGALRSDVRRLEQDRKLLKEKARRTEQASRAMLSQARGEVEAARRSLKALKEAHEREMAARQRRYEIQIHALRQELALARSQFVRSLRELVARSRWDVLQGRSVSVEGNVWDHDIQRLLVESVGGRLVPRGGDVALRAQTGFTGLERSLRSLAMERVQIKCDGLYRKKGGRPGIAMSGLQVRLGDAVIYENSHVTYCGPLAGSLMAEYGAVAMALSWLVAAAPPPGAHLEIFSDCRALLARLRRKAPPKRKPGCVELDATVRRLVRKLERAGCHVEFRWVPRDQVHAVDRLCYHAYRNLGWYHRRGARPRASLRAFFREALHVNG